MTEEIDATGFAYADDDGVTHGHRTYRVRGDVNEDVLAGVRDICSMQLFDAFLPGQLLVRKPKPPVEVAPGVFHITVEFDVLPLTDGPIFCESSDPSC